MKKFVIKKVPMGVELVAAQDVDEYADIIPKDYPSALRALADAEEKNAALMEQVLILRQQIAEMNPKVTYYDVVLNCADPVPTSEMAKDYGWDEVEMNEYLHLIGILHKHGKLWSPDLDCAAMGYTKTIPNDSHAYWTQKGRLFIYERLKVDGIYPLIEQQDSIAGQA